MVAYCNKVVILVLLLGAVFFSAWGGTDKRTRILVISSFHLRHHWTLAVCNAIDDKFSAANGTCVVDYLELNAVRDRQGNFESKFNAYLPQIRNGDYDMVVAILDDAINLIVNHYDTLPADLPIVFAGYRDYPAAFKEKHPNITGFGGGYNLVESLELMLRLYPATREIVIISDDLSSGISLNEQAMALQKDFTTCRLTLLNGKYYTTQQVIAHVTQMSPDSLVLFTPWRNFSKDGFASLENVALELRQSISHPYFILTDVLFGYGTLGGYVSDGESQGRELVKIMGEILDGRPVREMPFLPVPTSCIVDMKPFYREGLDRSRLPANAILRNDTLPFWQVYPVESAIGVGFGVILIGMIAGLALMHRRYRKASEAQLQEITQAHRHAERLSKERQIIIQSIGDSLVVTDAAERIILVNSVAANLAGYTPEEVMGKPFDTVFRLVSSQDNLPVPSPVTLALKYGEPAGLPEHTELVARDGTKRYVSDSAAPIRDEAGAVSGVVMVFRDVTSEFRQRDRTRMALTALNTAAMMSKISYCRLDVVNGQVTIAAGEDMPLTTAHNWSFEEGRPVASERWVHPEDLSGFLAEWEGMLRHGKTELSLRYRSSFDGEVRYFSMRVKPFTPIAAGEGRSYICVVQDISALGEAERAANDNNALLRTILDILPCPLLVKDARDNYKFIMVNRKFREMTSLSDAQLIGYTDFDVFERDKAAHYRRDDVRAVEERTTITLTEELPGEKHTNYLRTIKTYLETPSGKLLSISTAADITEAEVAKQDALNSLELLKHVFDTIPVGLFLKDPDNDFRYVMWNAVLQSYTGVSGEFMIGKTDSESLICPERGQHFRLQDRAAMEGNAPETTEEIFGINRIERVCRKCKTPITLPGGKRYLLGSFVDFTKEKQLEQELKQSVTRLEVLLKNEHIYNDCLRTISINDNFEQVIQYMLDTIGENFGVDRCFISCGRPPADATDRNFEWVREGIDAQFEFWQKFPLENIGRIYDELQEKGCGRIYPESDDAGIYAAMKEFAGERFDVKSLMLFRICEQDRFWGVIGFSFVRASREITASEEEMLKNCVRLFLLAKEHARQQLSLKSLVHIRNMIFNTIKIPIFLFDANEKLINVNPAACALAGKSEAEIVRSPCYENYCGNACMPANCPMHTTMATGKTSTQEMNFHGREMRITAEPIFDANGKIVYVLENAIDMTDINQAHRNLRTAMESALAADRAKSNFIATMNHELRTPLNAVIGFSEILQLGGIDDAEQRDCLQSINSAGKALLGLINDILDITKLDSESALPAPERCDCAALFQEITALFKENARAKNIALRLILPEALPELYIDAARLRQIVLNLLGNAIKFTHMGSVEFAVRFASADATYGCLELIFEDTGIGIRAELIGNIFDPFFQDEQVRKSRAYQGGGMGLTITRKLVAAMGGEISVRSHEHIGSTFTVIFRDVKFAGVERGDA